MFLQLAAKQWHGLVLFTHWEQNPSLDVGLGRRTPFVPAQVHSLHKTVPGDRDVLNIIILMHF